MQILDTDMWRKWSFVSYIGMFGVVPLSIHLPNLTQWLETWCAGHLAVAASPLHERPWEPNAVMDMTKGEETCQIEIYRIRTTKTEVGRCLKNICHPAGLYVCLV